MIEQSVLRRTDSEYREHVNAGYSIMGTLLQDAADAIGSYAADPANLYGAKLAATRVKANLEHRFEFTAQELGIYGRVLRIANPTATDVREGLQALVESLSNIESGIQHGAKECATTLTQLARQYALVPTQSPVKRRA